MSPAGVATPSAARILIVEDEPRLAQLVRRVLTPHVERIELALDGDEALDVFDTAEFDLVILDLLLPGRDGVEVLSEVVARKPGQKVLVLSALSAVEDRVRCLRLGAADYMVKPFAIDELVARVAARLRDSGARLPDTSSGARPRLDPRKRTADVGAGPVRLAEKEYLLLEHLVRDAPAASDRDALLVDVWGESADVSSNLVEACVRRLRQKLGHDVIETVRNVGYRFAAR